MQLPARQRGFQHVTGVHGTLGLTCADHGMNLVNEQDDRALLLGQLLQDTFQALLKLAAEFGPGNQRPHIQCQNFLVFQTFGHLSVDNTLGQAFNDGCLAHARLPDQYRVVFGAALQYLYGAPDFTVTANHWVQVALARAFSQINTVFGQCLPGLFSIGIGDFLATPQIVDRGFQGLLRDTKAGHQPSQLSLVGESRQDDGFAGDEFIPVFLRCLVSLIQKPAQLIGHGDVSAIALNLGQTLQDVIQSLAQCRQIKAGLRQQGPYRAAFLIKQTDHQVDRLNKIVVITQRQRLRIRQRGLQLACQLIHSHHSPQRISFRTAQESGSD